MSITKKLATYFCRHEFKGRDMKLRDDKGVVRWHCHKCKKTFEAGCGLDILKNGKCIGDWGFGDDKQ